MRYTGTVAADGTLYGGAEIGPGGHAGTPEPRLTERLVERALKTGAKIIPVEGAADRGLRDAVGIAAGSYRSHARLAQLRGQWRSKITTRWF